MNQVYSVTQVTAYIKELLQQDYALGRIYIKGEVSNCKYHTSGHIYFTLKDAGGQLPCVMFASARGGLSYRMKDGDRVVVLGGISVYEQAGRYQLYAREIMPDGTGSLYLQFEQLKKRLEEEGIFDPAHKKPVPEVAWKIGIVTALTGAAIQDMIQIASRRNPYAQLILCPAQVQGEGAAASVARGIRRLDRMDCDVIIVGRGGGSIEDLWAFNEAEVAYAIYGCRTPVISAVGHETDTTIADYAADLRAPTPSAAAELAVCDIRQILQRVEQYRMRLEHAGPAYQMNEKRQRLMDWEEKLGQLMGQRILENRHRAALAAGRLDGLSPLKKLSGGYAFVSSEEGKAVPEADALEPGQTVILHFMDGEAWAEIQKKRIKRKSSRKSQPGE